jgi:glycerol uptake facilitator-like aquaporin
MSGGNLYGVVFTFFCLLQILGPVSGGHMNPAVSLGVYIREGKSENTGFLIKIIIMQFIGAFVGVALSCDALSSTSMTWRKQYPHTSIPESWMPTVCPVNPTTGDCDGTGRAMQVALSIVIGTFFFVFMILLVKTPGYSPSDIGFINCAVIAGALFAFVGCTHLLGGGLNPAAVMGVMYAHDMQRIDSTQDFMSDNDPSAYWRAYLFCPFIGGLLAGYMNKLHIGVLSAPQQKGLLDDQQPLKEVELNTSDA